MDRPWHRLDAEETLRALGSRHSGLTFAEARDRLLEYGPNELQAGKKTPGVLVFLRQFLSPLIYILLVAGIVSIAAGRPVDAWVILAVLLLNALIGYSQETRAEKAMETVVQLAAPRARVRREGRVAQVPARDVAPGDILLLESGDRVPADARLLELSNLRVNESALTGESVPAEKHTMALDAELPLAERRNMAYMGTVVAYGRATAVAVATGMSTEIGRIAGSLREVKPERTPLQRSLVKLSHYVILLVGAFLVVLVAMGLLRDLGLFDLFLLSVAAAVSAIPEGLPAVVTVVLAVAMRMMARRNAIVRRLVAVETLGAATVICSDKTGTLTLNQMTVRRVFVDSQLIEVSGEGYQPIGDFRADGRTVDPLALSPLALHLKIGALCNDALLSREEKCCDVLGDPTEGALVVLAAKAGMDKERLESVYPRLGEIPFQSEKQFMATLHPRDGGRVAYVKGAPERLLALSSYVLTAGGVIPLEPAKAQEIARANASLAGEALRVIATAYVEMPTGNGGLDETHIQGTLVFVGLSGMDDPPRPEAFRAVKLCQQAGIKVVMITGDHKLTAESVARQLELPAGETVSGPEVQGMSDEELSRRIEGISVFARIEPLHKLRIVTAFKSRGHVVAMTGDGVNDAPALKAADIGVAMGVTGTDVAKEAADMILADDDFATVVAAVEEGRATFNRLRGAVFFLLSSNLGELLALILSVSFFGAAPLLAVQILWVNLVTDGASGVPLGLEPKSGDELRQPPRHPGVGLIFPGLLLRTFYMSAFMGLGVFLVFGWAMARSGAEEARTVAFCAMVAFEWGKAFNARSDEHTIFALGPLRNRWLVGAIALAVVLQVAVVYLPPLQAAFGTVSLGAGEWGVVVLAGAALFSIEEARKALFPRLFALGKWKPVSWTSETRR